MKKNISYMNDDELADFRARMGAHEFDPECVKNKHTDISYGPLPEHLLDIYLPDGADAQYPTLMYIHGGGWTMGNKRLCALDSVIGLIKSGWAVLSIDYRLAPQINFPDNVFDVKAALAWIYEYGDNYGLDRTRVVLAGDSAGGHLSLMAGFTQKRAEYSGALDKPLAAVKAVISLYGPTDLGVDFEQSFSESGVKTLPPMMIGGEKRDINALAFGATYKPLLTLNSPISLVTEDSPPVLLLHGKQDAVVPYQQSVMLKERMDKVCGQSRAKILIYPDRNHSDPAFLTEENVGVIAEFLCEVFGG